MADDKEGIKQHNLNHMCNSVIIDEEGLRFALAMFKCLLPARSSSIERERRCSVGSFPIILLPLGCFLSSGSKSDGRSLRILTKVEWILSGAFFSEESVEKSVVWESSDCCGEKFSIRLLLTTSGGSELGLVQYDRFEDRWDIGEKRASCWGMPWSLAMHWYALRLNSRFVQLWQ